MFDWKPCELSLPADKLLVWVTGDAGYGHTRRFHTTAFLDRNYRPWKSGQEPRWLDVKNDLLSDNGWTLPTHWSMITENMDPMKIRQLAYDIVDHLRRQLEWSKKTFGPGPRTEGVVDHITKELKEILADPFSVDEWCDVIILGLDGAWRTYQAHPLIPSPDVIAEDVIRKLIAKQNRNYARRWPDWRTAPPGKAIEHDRSKDEGN